MLSLFEYILQGFAPHISPFTGMQDIGNLLTRSGYSLLTVVSINIKTYLYFPIFLFLLLFKYILVYEVISNWASF